MRPRTRSAVLSCASLAFLIWVSTVVSAQEASVLQSPSVTAVATSERVRFISFEQVTHVRLEVFSSAGDVLFDSGFKAGDLLDWELRDQQGQRLNDGSYLCAVTVKDLSGRLSQRHGLVALLEKQVSLQRVSTEQLSAGAARAWAHSRATQALGTAQESGDLLLIAPTAMTATTHDGQNGQVTSTTGALIFRTGDLFSGKEQEQMRITPEGRVGIGISAPEETLDVAGTIRARGGIRFDDGTFLTSARALRSEGVPGDDVTVAVVSGSGTANRLAKWLDGTGTLGDSLIFESGINVGIGTTTPTAPLDVVYNDNSFGFGFNIRNANTGTQALTGYGINNAASQRVGQFVYVPPNYTNAALRDTLLFSSAGPTTALGFISSADGSGRPDIFFRSGTGPDNIHIKGATGLVGIGTSTPTERLEVSGNLRITGTSNGIIFPDGTKQTTAGGGLSGSGTTGVLPLWAGSTALGDSVITQSAGNIGIGTTTPTTPLELVYNNNSIGFGFNIRNTNDGPEALVAFSLNNVAGSRAGQFVYVPPTYMDVNMRDTLLLSSVGPATRLGIISASMAGGAPDIFFRAGGGNPNRLLIHGATGNVGVGTDAPTQRLDVAGNLKVTGTGNGIIFSDGTIQMTAAGAGGLSGSGTTGVLPLWAGSTALGDSVIAQSAGNIGIGTTAPTSSLDVAGAINASTQFNLGGSRVLSAAGEENIFAGFNAGAANTTGHRNTFVGHNAGTANTTGRSNSFFGRAAGVSNVSGINNTFVGSDAGTSNTAGNENNFFGASAGQNNTTGSFNLFFGDASGNQNTTGNGNVFVGDGAGLGNQTGSRNLFVGRFAGQNNTTGENNTVIGYSANVTTPNLLFATAIGSQATVATSNTIALGRADGSDKVRIFGLGTAGSTQLCRNANNEVSACSSSLRYKTNVAPFSPGLGLLQRLRPIRFNWKDGGMQDIGFGAEDVAAVEPLLVTYDDGGRVEGVRYDRISTVLVNAVKEQQTQIETQQAQLEAQQQQLRQQQTLIDGLKKLLCRQNPTADICQEQ